MSLNKVIPEHLKDTDPLRYAAADRTYHRGSKTRCRKTSTSIEEHDKRGKEFFKALYGDTAEGVQGLLDAAMPDLGMPIQADIHTLGS